MWQKFVIAIGRVLIAAIFIMSGVNKLFNWSASIQHLESVFSDWQAYVGEFSALHGLFGTLMSLTPLVLGIAVAFEIIGGCSVLIGYRPKWGALLLILFLIPTTIIVHHFWFLAGHARDEEMITFIRNCAILGGLLVLWASSSLLEKKHVGS